MIVADTHALLWWFGDRHQLSAQARMAFDRESVGVAVITCFEITRLSERRRIVLDQDVFTWIDNLFALPQFTLLSLTVEIAVTAAKLPDPISDPIDRIIVATAMHHGVPLVTKDAKITAAALVPTLW